MPLNDDSVGSASTLSGPASDEAESRTTSTASKRFVSAPFLLQGQLGRRAPTTSGAELLVVDTPPSYRTNPHIQTLSPPLQLRATQAMSLNPSSGATPASQLYTTTAPQNNNQTTNAGVGVLPRSTPQTLESSNTAATTIVETPLTSASARSMPYTWTDSYLEESPEATRTRWMTRQTFGPVLQSEGGGSSTVVSTPRGVRQDGEGIWGGVLDRNAMARGEKEAGAAASSSRPSTGAGSGEEAWCTSVHSGGSSHDYYHYQQQQQHQQQPPQRRFNLEAAERGGAGLGRAVPLQQQQQRQAAENNGPSAALHRNGPLGISGPSTAAKALFPATKKEDDTLPLSAAPHHLVSDVSTVIATVQQPRRGAQIAPVGKPSPPPPATTSIQQEQQQQASPSSLFQHTSSTNAISSSDNRNVFASTSVAMLSTTMPLNAPELRAPRNAPSPQPPRSPATSANEALNNVRTRASGRSDSSRSSSAGDNISCGTAEASTSDLVRTSGGEPVSRNGPLRRRVLKPIYDD